MAKRRASKRQHKRNRSGSPGANEPALDTALTPRGGVRARSLLYVVGGLLLVGAVGSVLLLAIKPNDRLAVPVPDGTRRMAELLDEIANEADPRTNPYLLNEARAALAASELRAGGLDQTSEARLLFFTANEFLLGGRTEAAIEMLERLRSAVTTLPEPDAAELRPPVEELLGLS